MNTDEKKEPEVAKTASAPEKLDEPQRQVEETQTDAARDKESAEKQTTPGAQKQKIKGKTPQDTLHDYLAMLNAVDATVAEDVGAQEQNTESEAETDDKAIEPQGTHWLDDSLQDLTPVLVIQASQDLDKGEQLGDEDLYRDMVNFQSVLNDKSKTVDQRAELFKRLLERFCAHCNFAVHRTNAIFADYAILAGKSMLAMKDFAEAAKKTDPNFPQWGVWAAANIAFLSERRRQEWMAAAKRTDAHEFSYLGLERLLHLIRATEKMSGDNRIRDFLKKYNIPFDPNDEALQLNEFKLTLDAALGVHKAAEIELRLDLGKVKTLIQVGGQVDRKMLCDCAIVAQIGGDPNDYIDKLIQNRGKRIDFFEGEDLAEHIVTLFNRLKKGIDQLIADPNALKKLAVSEIEPLESRITSLKETLSSLPAAATEDIPQHTVNLLKRLEKDLDKLTADPNALKKVAVSQIEALGSRIAGLKATRNGPPPAATGKSHAPPAAEDSPAATDDSTPPDETKDGPPPDETE